MKIQITNSELTVLPPVTARQEDLLQDLRDETRFFVDGAHHTDSYQSGRWDGYEYLLRKMGGRWRAPIGLLEELLQACKESGLAYEVIDKRRHPGRRLMMSLALGWQMRDYQDASVQAVLKDRGPLTGKGMLKLATRAGKTLIAMKIIADLGHRALFIVNSDDLLNQTVARMREVLRCEEVVPGGLPLVGQYGGGVKKPGWITVASVQSLTRRFYQGPSDRRIRELKAKARKAGRKPRIPKPPSPATIEEIDDLLNLCDVAFFDECHHLEAEEWRKAMRQCDALYKVGLSATIFVDRKGGTAKGTIWLVGATGRVLYEVGASELIRRGWLSRPVINFVEAPHPRISTLPAHMRSEPPDIEGGWATVYRDGIVENMGRNDKIAAIAAYEHRRGNRVLVTLQQVKHVAPLGESLAAEGLKYAIATGKTRDRAESMRKLRDREVQVLIGTIFKEAVDLPWLECVIIGDGGASKVLAMQRLRNLTAVGDNDKPLGATPKLPPDEVPVYDFLDRCCKTLQKHSLARLRAYREEEEFRIVHRRDL